MSGKLFEKWIDRVILDSVRRMPFKPLIAIVFAQLDADLSLQMREKDNQFLRLGSISILQRFDNVTVFELEFFVDIDVVCGDPGFFFQFAQGALKIGFSRIDVAFGQVPAIGMSHQQKRWTRIVPENEKPARFHFCHVHNLCQRDARCQTLSFVTFPGNPMKIYTKTGDHGETGLLGGIRVSKSHWVIRVCGSLDETNSFVGLARCESTSGQVDNILTQIQHDLFDLGSQVAACLGVSNRPPEFPSTRSAELESMIDNMEDQLDPLSAFILPSGSRAGSTIHLARSVCRRAERELVELIDSGLGVDLSIELVYLNRLGDLLFVLARYVNKLNNSPETQWNAGRRRGENQPGDSPDRHPDF